VTGPLPPKVSVVAVIVYGQENVSPFVVAVYVLPVTT
jgi:hypothetical protein